MRSTCLILVILCWVLGTLTSAVPVDKRSTDDVTSIQALNSRGNEAERQSQVEDKMGELQDQTESPPPEALSFQRHIDQYKQAALNMADEDFFPEHLCENGTLSRMRHVLSNISHDELQRALVMMTFMQSEGCPKGALHTATKLMELVKNATSQHRPDVMAEIDDVTSEYGTGGYK